MSTRAPAPGLPGRRAACRTMAVSLVAAALACRARPADGGTVRIALQGEPTSLDPHLQDDVITYSVLFNVYEALTSFDGDMRLQPGLAVGWHSRDEHTWVFDLRPGVTFHDGRPVLADDVVASLDRARNLPGSQSAGFLVGVSQVRRASAARVEIVTGKPYALLAKKLAWVAIVPRDAPPLIERPIGTGPARFVERRDTTITLERAPAYWGTPIAHSHVEILSAPGGPERARLVAEGGVDIVTNLDSASVPALEQRSDVRVVPRPSLTIAYIGLRCDRAPFSDVRLRRAVHLAVDREQLVIDLRRGLASPAGQVVDRHVFGFDPALPVAGRDVAGARQLLTAAGFPSGLDVTLEHRDGFDSTPLVRQLAEAGLRLRVVTRPWKELLARLTTGAVDMYLGGVVCPTGDASDVLDQVLHSRDETTGHGTGNHWGYASQPLDDLIESSAATFDQESRLILLKRAMRLLTEDVPLVPLYVPFNVAAVRRSVTWEPRLDGMVRVGEMRPA